jgi:RNA polymerase sigma-70 factor, ECF subfamily
MAETPPRAPNRSRALRLGGVGGAPCARVPAQPDPVPTRRVGGPQDSARSAEPSSLRAVHSSDPRPLGAGALFRAHAPFVARFLQRLGLPAGELDDLLQEVFIVAHRKGGYLPGPATPRGWLAAIALRVAQAGRRAHQRRERPAGAEVELVRELEDPARRLEVRRAMERVQLALDGLLLEHRAVFVLYEIEGESCELIAEALGIPIGTVYSRLHHARRRFLSAHEALRAAERSEPDRSRGER